ncbi:glycosyltransferase [Aurantimonas sp. 22II-16-19i]|uniref:glycosyltransferase n=1 Tax=Aurantimonas sp. 22II-16-19i TaxID=1317114 RepID=UPI0009F7E451|nr:glycosyltransferase [Aurantimonas sp. 22II-16-19i]ORE89942.1 glycosyl transferase [Aurantimonas sp. 22II-16-19i]
MHVTHLAPHLGGGVGKAHAALAEARREQGNAEQHRFVLLETPQDGRFADQILATGAEVIVQPAPDALRRLVAAADILQVEWWSHPRLYECLARAELPPHRLLLWTHVSGLAPPVIPADLVALARVTAFTSACSFEAANLKPLIAARPQAFAVANSGFGFDAIPKRPSVAGQPLRFGLVGTLDFAKLHPRFFDAIDGAACDIGVRLFGHCDPGGAVAARAAAMRQPSRVMFEGHTDDPAAALAGLDVFVHLLAPGHYGTGENALIEAMSLGLCPLVLDNPAERAIVTHQETGIVAASIAEAAGWLDWMAGHPGAVASLGAEAARRVARTHRPAASLSVFRDIQTRAMAAPKRARDYAGALGDTPAAWFAASLGGVSATGPGEAVPGAGSLFAATPAKGSLAHFRRCFPDDAALLALARGD